MAKKIKTFLTDSEYDTDEKKSYKTFTMVDNIRDLANETIVMRASLNPSRKKLENFSEFIRNLIIEENERQKIKLINDTRDR